MEFYSTLLSLQLIFRYKFRHFPTAVVSGVSRMYELEQSDKLTPDKIAIEVTMIAACLLPFGKGLKWLGGELYVAVTGGVETAAVGLGVYYVRKQPL